ncbi:DUF2867 domain-containing protein [Dactylosporangium aurantiacum]|uniref:DUF2867 domain-containing protein n=1 Tax=Dactylosporangium aurantiacum TaxID=35754 RepID=A0A9Q9I9M4_9ACTN|nr:DUF2867 domain-containing protein [Dactylosporangium aurantiacum]MDG6103542.1 DUF2867 domain-containing protein [Dactylosporangium aurantiacum]UWZ51962.1 DUF2867 domain-containing protein [Dactylosporangium aurantiacum]
MRNVQRRTIDAPMDRLGALLDRVAGPDDPLWPAPAWPPMRFDRPLGPGATGGHGMIRYTVVEHVPGRLLRCRFDPTIGVVGEHELRLEPAGQGTALVHVIDGRLTGGMRWWWPLAVRWLHEALLQDLLDNAERAATGTVRRPARWSWWVRLMRRAVAGRARRAATGERRGQPRAGRPRRVPLPHGARLAAGTLDRVDLMDAWQGPRPPGASTDPAAWRAAMFGRPPRWVGALMRLRNHIPGLEPLHPKEVFTPLDARDDEVLFGADTRHFDLRVSLFVDARSVVCSTLARPRTRRGRAYLAVVGRVHPLVVRTMLGRALRSAPPATAT